MKAKLVLLLGCIFMAISCEKDSEDSSEPTISGITINGKAKGALAEAGDSMIVVATAKDNQSLGTLMMRIKSEGTGNWNEERSPKVSGSEQDIEEVFIVPGNVKDGNYFVEFTLVDEKGNTGKISSDKFQVVNNLKPQFNVTVPSVQGGDTLKLQGTITDNSDLTFVVVTLEIPPGYSGDPMYYQEQINIPGSSDITWDLQKDGKVEIYFPPFAKTGDYSLKITAFDNDGNLNSFNAKVKI